MEPALFKLNIRRSRITNSRQLLADEIYTYFSKRIPFPRLMKMISEKGEIFVRETFQEIQKSDCEDRLALFIWKVGKQQILYEK